MGLSIWHMLLLLGIVLLVFGPSRLPSLGSSLGEAIRGFKKGISGEGDIDVTDSVKRDAIKGSDESSPTSAQTQRQSDPTRKS